MPAAPAVDVSTAFDTGTLPAPSPSALSSALNSPASTGPTITSRPRDRPSPRPAKRPRRKTACAQGLSSTSSAISLRAIQGVRVDAKTTMTDFMANDTVRTEVQGLIKGIEISDASWDGEIYTVTGRVKTEKCAPPCCRDFLPPGQNPFPQHLLQARSAHRAADRRDASPSHPGDDLPRRRRKRQGSVRYRLCRRGALASGLCDYHTNLAYAKGAPRIASTPLVAKAVRTVAPQNVDIVISKWDAAKVRGSSYDFRVPCRVTVVKR